MARDPPVPTPSTCSSELRDLSLSPSSVRRTRISIVHPQLRDLILPLARGKLLYPRDKTVEEYSWEPSGDDDGTKGSTKAPPGTTSTVARLTFTPNCLTVRGNILACGGQHGQLYLSTLPSSTSAPTTYESYTSRFERTLSTRPFTISETLPKHAINNSLTILPSWPEEWKKRERARKSIYSHRDERFYDTDDDEDSGEDDIARESVRGGRRDVEEGDEEDDDDDMDVDDEEDDDEDMGEIDELPSPSSSVATYPNTVPFLHPPRLPHLSPSQPSVEIPVRRSSTNRRSTSFGSFSSVDAAPTPTARASFASTDRPNVQYVSSLPIRTPPDFRAGSSVPSVFSSTSVAGSTGSAKRKRKAKRNNEPRLLISNNDQTVKMFSIRQQLSASGDPLYASNNSHFDDRSSLSATQGTSGPIPLPRLRFRPNRPNRPAVGPPQPRFGSAFGWEGIGMNEGILDGSEGLRVELERAREHLRNTQETLRREREEFERRLGVNIGPGGIRTGGSGTSTSPENGSEETREQSEIRERRRLIEVGGSKFKYAINHSSLSPDLTTMVSVGDSTEVYIFQVLNGGRDFKRVATYESSGKGFSTSWSKDGRKFAVASEDGQVTVWDHRSSRPLALFHTSPTSPSFTSDLSSSWSEPASESRRSPQQPMVVLYDPVTGESSTGSSTSGREAARVVKFSPEGSSRDLMVFTEENSNLHIVDARTFNEHVVVPVPYDVPNDSANSHRDRGVLEEGQVGIAGVAFDPTGNWLYSGTEKTIVEWDLRRLGGSEGGTWGMA